MILNLKLLTNIAVVKLGESAFRGTSRGACQNLLLSIVIIIGQYYAQVEFPAHSPWLCAGESLQTDRLA